MKEEPKPGPGKFGDWYENRWNKTQEASNNSWLQWRRASQMNFRLNQQSHLLKGRGCRVRRKENQKVGEDKSRRKIRNVSSHFNSASLRLLEGGGQSAGIIFGPGNVHLDMYSIALHFWGQDYRKLDESDGSVCCSCILSDTPTERFIVGAKVMWVNAEHGTVAVCTGYRNGAIDHHGEYPVKEKRGEGVDISYVHSPSYYIIGMYLPGNSQCWSVRQNSGYTLELSKWRQMNGEIGEKWSIGWSSWRSGKCGDTVW